MAHFYLAETLDTAVVGGRTSIIGQEARHAVTVSRIGLGERVSFGDGVGRVVTGTVVAAESSELVIEVEEFVLHEQQRPAIFLAQALAKGDRDEMAVQAATELGVDGVLPWSAQRSVSRWEGPKVRKGHDRWTAVVREASKQSIRPWIPDVLDLVSTRQLALMAGETRMLVLEPSAERSITSLDFDERDVLLVVGPEGGIAPGELQMLVSAGAEPVSLGSGVLRTSTAGPAAIAVLSAKLGRW